MTTLFSVLLLSFSLNTSDGNLPADGDLDGRHQAMYLFSLVKNIDWHSDTFVIGIVGETPVTNELKTLAKRNSKVEIRNFTELATISECNMVFIPEASNSVFFQAQNTIGDDPILLVVDKKQLVARGAEMGFYVEDNKLKFVVNKQAIEDTGVRISHTLMERAKKVE